MKDIRTLIQMINKLRFILNRKQLLQSIGVFFVIVIGSGFELLGVSVIMPFIQAVLKPEELTNKPYIKWLTTLFGISTSVGVITIVGVGIVIIYLVKNTYLAFSAYIQTKYCNNIQRELSTLMLASYIKKPYTFFVENGCGNFMQGMIGDISGVYVVIVSWFKLLSEILTIIVISIYLFFSDPVLSVFVFLAGLFCMLIMVFGLKNMLTRMSSIFRKAGSNLNRRLIQVVDGIKDIIIFDRRDFFVDEYNNAYKDYSLAKTNSTFAGLVPERVIEAFCISGIVIAILVRIHMGVNVDSFIPTLGVFVMGAFRLLPSVSRSAGYISDFVFNRAMVDSTYKNIISVRSDPIESSCMLSQNICGEDALFEEKIEMIDIDWRYPGKNEKVLDKLSLEIFKGETIGIIGESGAGKSTLADILLCIYKPESGSILMDNRNINDIPKQWKKIISYVPQTVFLMDDTIKANVAFGLEVINDDQVLECIKKASLYTYVSCLPDGLETIIGDQGVKLSGGQRQRLAIARALYQKPEVLILDEATSALDNDTEEEVMDAISRLAGEMTLIIIAHRLSTLRECDRIYEILNGKAIERRKEDVIIG